ncbi:sugar transferase [Hyphomicrobium sp.]|uniref:sugar transferase n=1 Tax=Hyphomicrobium sp. TaxID=82 RepID=UPI002D77C84B|nr:sugar transferase [Hyphomicrobium sp.]HET6389270.1 sugar transferase [Hyphomicrobium sp.]
MHHLVLLIVDVAFVLASTILAIVLCSPLPPISAVEHAGIYPWLTIGVAIPVLWIFGLNRTVWRFTSLNDCWLILAAAVWIVVFSIAANIAFEGIDETPRSLPVMQGLLILCTLGGARAVMRLRHSLRHRARMARERLRNERENVLLIGLNPVADLFLRCAAENARGHVHIAGILSNAERHHGRSLHSCKILGPPETAEEVLHDLAVHGIRISRLVLTIPLGHLSKKAQEAIAEIRRTHAVRVDELSAQYGWSELMADRGAGANNDTSEAPAGAFAGNDGPPSSYLRWKRVIDATAAVACIICLAPVMAIISVAVMLDVGFPLIFWQQRPGAFGHPIRVLKFRTMRRARDASGRTLTDAERVSRVGSLLRRLRLDELPQVYNVLLGHMSLVGPRPLLPVDQPSFSEARLRLRPGLTGWAQIKGGRHLSREDKAALDLWYIKNASFALDMLILLNTARTVLFGERIDPRAIDDAWRDLRP